MFLPALSGGGSKGGDGRRKAANRQTRRLLPRKHSRLPHKFVGDEEAQLLAQLLEQWAHEVDQPSLLGPDEDADSTDDRYTQATGRGPPLFLVNQERCMEFKSQRD